MANKSYVGDVGTKIDIDCEETITGATTTEYHVRKPDGTEVVWVASILDSTTLRYVSLAGDFDQAGVYKLNVSLVLPTPWSGLGETFAFRIYEKYG